MADSNVHLDAAWNPAEKNIRAIANLEHEALNQRTVAERVSDAITRVTGSMTFVILHILAFALWVLVNLNWVPGVRAFDPFPFGVLTLIVSTEGVFLAIFILISQNRMTRQADQRSHLNLQINLLAERETTKMLQMLQAIYNHLGLGQVQDEETRELVEELQLERLAREIREKLPGE